MSTIRKSTSATISMIALVLSLAVVSPTTAIGKGNRRTKSPDSSQQGTNPKGRNLRPSGTGLRSAASGTRNPKQGTPLLVGGAGGAGSLGLLDYQGYPVTTYARK